MRPGENTTRHLHYDVVVIGGGTGGFGAAMASARHGARTALIQERPVLGGNNSSEIRMHISGADAHAMRKDARETGLVEEVALKNRVRNPQNSFCVSDAVYWEMAAFQENLDLFLNTCVYGVTMEGEGRIGGVSAVQLASELKFQFSARIFVDATGDGTIAALSGAETMYGREAKAAFSEEHGLDKPDEYTMGNTIMFTTKDMGYPVPYLKPEWAYSYDEIDLKYRKHCAGEAIWRAKAGIDSGYWWIELGGRDESVIEHSEQVRDELIKVLYGVWDHVKNGGEHGAENLALDWVGYVPGKRESRRIVGDYVLVEEDLMQTRTFDDAVAYGGWTLDRHVIGGMRNLTEPPADLLTPPDVYQIPYRCYYAKNVENLMMAGRNISCTHLAMSSTRVMGTCMVGGQAVGVAAAVAVREGILPREVGKRFIREVQQALLNDDLYIPGLKNEDERDLARTARVCASSSMPGFDAQNVLNGVHRGVGEASNLWMSRPLRGAAEWLELTLDAPRAVGEVVLRFDSGVSDEIFVSINQMQLLDQAQGVPRKLVRDYRLVLIRDGRAVEEIPVKDNAFRHRVHKLNGSVLCDAIRLEMTRTNGDDCARVFEIRAYER